EFKQRGAADDPGIVQEDVDLAESCHGFFHDLLNSGTIQQTSGNLANPSTERLHFGGGLVGANDIHDYNIGPRFRKAEGGALTQATCSAYNERHFLIQT